METIALESYSVSPAPNRFEEMILSRMTSSFTKSSPRMSCPSPTSSLSGTASQPPCSGCERSWTAAAPATAYGWQARTAVGPGGRGRELSDDKARKNRIHELQGAITVLRRREISQCPVSSFPAALLWPSRRPGLAGSAMRSRA